MLHSSVLHVDDIGVFYERLGEFIFSKVDSDQEMSVVVMVSCHALSAYIGRLAAPHMYSIFHYRLLTDFGAGHGWQCMSKDEKKFPALIRVRRVFFPDIGHAFIMCVIPLPKSRYMLCPVKDEADGPPAANEESKMSGCQGGNWIHAAQVPYLAHDVAENSMEDVIEKRQQQQEEESYEEDDELLETLQADSDACEWLRDALLQGDPHGEGLMDGSREVVQTTSPSPQLPRLPPQRDVPPFTNYAPAIRLYQYPLQNVHPWWM